MLVARPDQSRLSPWRFSRSAGVEVHASARTKRWLKQQATFTIVTSTENLLQIIPHIAFGTQQAPPTCIYVDGRAMTLGRVTRVSAAAPYDRDRNGRLHVTLHLGSYLKRCMDVLCGSLPRLSILCIVQRPNILLMRCL